VQYISSALFLTMSGAGRRLPVVLQSRVSARSRRERRAYCVPTVQGHRYPLW
jgi:hypothetical protein